METQTTVVFDHRSESIAKLAAALAVVQGELKHAKKQTENSYFKSSYADLPATIDTAKALLAKHGFAVVQIPVTDQNDGISLITELLHVSGEWLRSRYPIRPMKFDPQSIGSAITYARRYAYQAMIGIAAEGEDDDGNKASGKTEQEKTTEQAATPSPKTAKNYALKPSPAQASPQMSRPDPLADPSLHVIQGSIGKAKGHALKECRLVDLVKCLETKEIRARLTAEDVSNMELFIKSEQAKSSGLDDMPDFDSLTDAEKAARRAGAAATA